MFSERRKVLLTNIENYAADLAANGNAEQVAGILQKYQIQEFEELTTQECEDVFGELFQYEADNKD